MELILKSPVILTVKIMDKIKVTALSKKKSLICNLRMNGILKIKGAINLIQSEKIVYNVLNLEISSFGTIKGTKDLLVGPYKAAKLFSIIIIIDTIIKSFKLFGNKKRKEKQNILTKKLLISKKTSNFFFEKLSDNELEIKLNITLGTYIILVIVPRKVADFP